MYSLIENTREGTQNRIIAEIFERNVGVSLTKRDIEREYSLKWLFRNVEFPLHCESIDDLIQTENLGQIPGDVQRMLRTFHDKFKNYGLERAENDVDGRRILTYTWNPIRADEVIRPAAARTIFPDHVERERFAASRGNRCEICCNGDERLAVDHWRAHSRYNIDSPDIAVLLCETCNNIHHNFDAVRIVRRYQNRTYVIRNWIDIEQRVRDAGYPPDDIDRAEQSDIITQILINMRSDLSVDLLNLLEDMIPDNE